MSLVIGDSRAVLPTLDAERFDACVTDPPYEIGLVGKRWDRSGVAFDPAFWRSVLRTLKPGGHLLAFGGTRTAHRMVCAIEDAGFEIRDTLQWLYNNGYPKNARTQLKPAHEPITLARKPGPLLPLGIAECRLEGRPVQCGNLRDTEKPILSASMGPKKSTRFDYQRRLLAGEIQGRFPSNVLFSHIADCTDSECAPGCAVAELDRQCPPERIAARKGSGRFFFCGKASPRERLIGGVKNPHPTVKPLHLMRYLVRLACPEGGEVLDPFAGSGSTLVACAEQGRRYFGIEQSAQYAEIAQARLAGVNRDRSTA